MILVIKTGAYGDVVRTSFFFEGLKKRFNTEIKVFCPKFDEILGGHPFAERVEMHEIFELRQKITKIFSMDDESDCIEIASFASNGDVDKITGLYVNDGKIHYSQDSNEWNDMGIHSRFGLRKANELKKNNKKTYSEIMTQVFGVECLPKIYDNEGKRLHCYDDSKLVVINPITEGRWQNKSLNCRNLELLTIKLSEMGFDSVVVGPKSLYEILPTRAKRFYRDTTQSVLCLKDVIRASCFFISCDSLVCHLAFGLNLPGVVFFGPTSATEIDVYAGKQNFRPLKPGKLITGSAEYCSYTKGDVYPDLNTYNLIDFMGI